MRIVPRSLPAFQNMPISTADTWEMLGNDIAIAKRDLKGHRASAKPQRVRVCTSKVELVGGVPHINLSHVVADVIFKSIRRPIWK